MLYYCIPEIFFSGDTMDSAALCPPPPPPPRFGGAVTRAHRLVKFLFPFILLYMSAVSPSVPNFVAHRRILTKLFQKYSKFFFSLSARYRSHFSSDFIQTWQTHTYGPSPDLDIFWARTRNSSPKFLGFREISFLELRNFTFLPIFPEPLHGFSPHLMHIQRLVTWDTCA